MRFRVHPAAILAAAVTAVTFGCAPRGTAPGDRVLVHTVGADESLATIAEDYYGETRKVSRIRRFNELERGEEPETGDELRIPMSTEELLALELRRAARRPYNEGLDLVARGSYLDATMRFHDALDLDPDFVEARFNLGVTYSRMDAHDRAVEELRRAVRAKRDDPDYRFALGNAYFHLERYRDAADQFRAAIDTDPDHLKARFSLAMSYERSGRPERARREWRRYLERDAESEWADKAREHLTRLSRP